MVTQLVGVWAGLPGTTSAIEISASAALVNAYGGYMKTQAKPCHGWPHAQIHLPRMDSRDALLVINILERATDAIWRAHGDTIADYLACVDPDSPYMEKPFDAVWTGADTHGPKKACKRSARKAL
jgi:hypothetical protein